MKKNTGITWKSQYAHRVHGASVIRYSETSTPSSTSTTRTIQWPNTTRRIAATRSRAAYRFRSAGGRSWICCASIPAVPLFGHLRQHHSDFNLDHQAGNGEAGDADDGLGRVVGGALDLLDRGGNRFELCRLCGVDGTA